MKKKALITGVTGQDGAYLSELLLEKGCDVDIRNVHGETLLYCACYQCSENPAPWIRLCMEHAHDHPTRYNFLRCALSWHTRPRLPRI